MLRIITTICICLYAIAVAGKTTPPGWQWAVTGENTGESQGLSVSTDKDDNVYVAGYFKGSLKIGNTQLQSAGKKDIFIAKYDANGNAIWAKSAGGIADDECSSISVNETGVYVTGYFTDSATFESNKLIAVGLEDIFIAKYDQNGTLTWIKNTGTINWDRGTAVSIHTSNRIYVSGFYSSSTTSSHETIFFDTVPLTSIGEGDIFLVTYDLNGNVEWAKSAGGTSDEFCFHLVTDKIGNVFISGTYFSSTPYFDGIALSKGPANMNMFVAKYDASGNAILAITSNCDDVATAASVTVDDNGNFYAVGSYTGTIKFGNLTLPNSSQFEAYLTKYSALGSPVWTKSIGTPNTYNSGNDIGIDGIGNVYITGSYSAAAIFGDDTMNAPQDGNVFVAKYAPDGNSIWARAAFTGDAFGITVSDKGETLLTGYFKGAQATFGDHTLNNSSPANDNMFVAKLPAFATGIKDTPTPAPIAIYPNPVADKLFISNAAGAAYEVYDISGRLLSSGRVAGSVIDVHMLPTGTYLLKLIIEDGLQAMHFIKE